MPSSERDLSFGKEGVPNLLFPFTKGEAQTRRLFVPFNLRSRSSTPFTVPDIITLDQISTFAPPSLDTFVYDSISLSLFELRIRSKLTDGGGGKDNISRSCVNSKSEFLTRFFSSGILQLPELLEFLDTARSW